MKITEVPGFCKKDYLNRWQKATQHLKTTFTVL